ncbi:MAG: translation initiation factor IF-5A [Candidatus Pacearchaeota archaeon]
MAYKLINATEAKVGTTIIIDGEPCTVRSIDISKTGKHGHAKARIEASGIFDGKKRVIVRPGHERFEVPMIDKKKAQVLSISETANVMDLETFENFDIPLDEGIEVKEGDQVEYWDIDGRKIIKRKI